MESAIKNSAIFWPNLVLCLVICLLITVIYFPVIGFDFVNFDDPLYVYENSNVLNGLRWGGVKWAFGVSDETYWHPLTWISHMMDCQIFGANAGMHHVINVGYHILNSILLFIMFWRMTKKRWQSFLIAALFAAHPLCVDTVAWVSERKNLLSTSMFMLTILAYIRYHEHGRLVHYLGALFFFALGLLAKPMLVTMPGVLLLLDYWPLRRFNVYGETGQKLTVVNMLRQNSISLYDKLPFLLITIVYFIPFWASIRKMNALVAQKAISPNERLANAVISYIHYIIDVFWPQNLAVYYPFPKDIPLGLALGATCIIVGVTVFVVYRMRHEPWMIVGWFWFCGTLIPVIGGIQAGLWPARADRWVYLPSIGLFVCIVNGATLMGKMFRLKPYMMAFLSVTVLLLLTGIAHIQTYYWRDSEALFRRAIAVTKNNFIAYDNLGLALVAKGKVLEAHQYFLEALRINPNFEKAHHNLGASYLLQGDTEKAISHISEALRLNPNSARLHNNMGMLLSKIGQKENAIVHYRHALSIDPGFKRAEENLQKALAK